MAFVIEINSTCWQSGKIGVNNHQIIVYNLWRCCRSREFNMIFPYQDFLLQVVAEVNRSTPLPGLSIPLAGPAPNKVVPFFLFGSILGKGGGGY